MIEGPGLDQAHESKDEVDLLLLIYQHLDSRVQKYINNRIARGVIVFWIALSIVGGLAVGFAYLSWKFLQNAQSS